MKPSASIDVSKIEFELEEGFRVKALARRADLHGPEALCFRDAEFREREGFRIGTRIFAQSPKTIETKIREELALGANSFELAPLALDSALLSALDSALIAPVPYEVRFKNRPDAVALEWATRFTEKPYNRVSFGLDPILTYAGSKDELAFGQLKPFFGVDATRDRIRLFRVDLSEWCERGARSALEIAMATETVRYLRDRHFEGDLNIEWLTATGVQSFLGVAKLRALRRALTRAQAGVPTIVARNLEVEKTEFDATNVALRSTSAAWAGIIGGADTVELSSIDRRLSLTTLLILKEEGHLSRVVDPAFGSYAIESITEQLEREAEGLAARIRAEGGILGALRSGMIEAECASNRKWAANRVAQGRRTIVGVNEFIDSSERLDSLSSTWGGGSLRRPEPFSSAFERLRKVVSDRRQKVPVLRLEDDKTLKTRIEFVRSVLASGGFEAEFVSPENLALLKAAPIAVILGSDEKYETELVSVIRELRSLRVRKLILAGRPKGKEVEYARAGVDFFLYAGGDRVELLKKIFHEQGVPLENTE